MSESPAQMELRAGQLRQVGWDVLEVNDPIEALSHVKRCRVDLALLHLPVDDVAATDLPNVLRKVSTASYLPVLILVSTAEEEQRCRFLDSGADDAISAGTSPAETAARIRAMLRIKDLHDRLTASQVALEKALCRERKLLEKSRRDNEYLQTLATTDPLTRIQNVRSFHDILQHEFSGAVRYGRPLSLLMLDVDHFKVVNDTHGHPSGDYVLKELAVILKQSVRQSDVVARIGGEEFGVVLPKADPAQAAALAERIRQSVYERKFIVFGEQIHATISIGSASYPADVEITEAQMLVYFADQALLTAKEAGRDRVVAVNAMDQAVRRRMRRQYQIQPEIPQEVHETLLPVHVR